MGSRWIIRSVIAVAFVIALFIGCGGGDDNNTSPASLKQDLLPASKVKGFKVDRTFAWDNPIDVVARGIFLPEATPNSTAVNVFEDASFDAAAGEELVVTKGNPFQGPRIMALVTKLGSGDDARTMLDYLHKEDLKQPCFSVCSEDTSEIVVPGVPDAKGAQAVPQKKPPPDAPPPFTGYAAEFTIGPRLYAVYGGGGPGSLKKQQVTDAAKAFYDQNAAKSTDN